MGSNRKLYDLTAVGRYYKVYVGDNPEYYSQHSQEREAIESAVEAALLFYPETVYYVHDYEVEVGLTDAGITEAKDYGTQQDVAPTIISTPNPSFIQGTGGTYDFSNDISDDGLSALTYSLSNTLPNGLSLNASTGVLTYDGVEPATTSSHALTVTDAVGSDVSTLFNIQVLDQAWSYPGIPYLSDVLPAYSGATAPAGATVTTHDWYNNDPLTKANPTPTGAADEYYVKYNGDDGTAGNSGKGTASLPRATIPEGVIAAGSKIFIEGNNLSSGSDFTYDNGTTDGFTWTLQGTKASPVWIVGINAPRIGASIALTGCNHAIIDGIKVVDNGVSGTKAGRVSCTGPNTYLCIRNCEIIGAGLTASSGGSAGFSIGGSVDNWSEYICLFNTPVHDYGDWQDPAGGLDIHGGRPSFYSRWVWIIESSFYNLRGNGIQVGNSPPDPSDNAYDTSAMNPQFVYLGGNDIYNCNENAVACKGSYDVIISENKLHDSARTGSPGRLLVLTIDHEGNTADRRWAIANEIYNGSDGIRMAHVTTQDERCWVLNNYIHDCTGSALFLDSAGTPLNSQRFCYNNTAYGCASMFKDSSGGSGSDVTNMIGAGNICYNPTSTYFAEVVGIMRGANFVDSLVDDDTVTCDWSPKPHTTTNCITNQDPNFVDVVNGNIRLNSGSPAEGLTTVSSQYAVFESLYDININLDYFNKIIPASGSIDAGASQ